MWCQDDLVVDERREPERGPSRFVSASVVMGAVALLSIVPACSSPSTSSTASTSTSGPMTTSTTTPVTVPHQSPAQVAACKADAQSLSVALEAYMVQKGSFPTPPSPWSATNYTANFAPLIPQYMRNPLDTSSYVIEYDSSGHVWVAPAGSYGATYNPGQSFDANPDVCLAAVH